MEKEQIPWNKDDIFHDDVAAYPLPNYLPLADVEPRRADTDHDKEEETNRR
ncbi:MAG: hypothetical protein SCK29_05740 [Bacillota bacterium]|nr:hypothetical protein [Bacillota bacterium]